ncbi:metabolite traffic protein EboE [Aquipuribacter hungaricus]|uniref:Metabolite traffic protein EboE n=1 Tax=Aquipuribacter hungaricus TaxID=545624 RepID=A0ABV7WC06_9MICO
MRFTHRDGTTVHLAHCSNVHPAEDLDEVLAQVDAVGHGLRRRLDVPTVGIGLWLPAALAARLVAEPASLERLRRGLQRAGVEVVTVNAFPWGGFHAPVVKKAVYRPDWTTRDRLDYTLDCATVLARLMPDDAVRGSISTLPLGWRTPWLSDRQATAETLLARLEDGLAKVSADAGRAVRVGFEPEPGCIVETTEDAAERVAPAAGEHVGVCLDTCHLAVAFEDPHEALARLGAADLPVVKAQLAAALHAEDPADPATRAALEPFVEQRFLHQVRSHVGGRLVGKDDLDEALAGARPLSTDEAWRVHVHVPLHADPAPPLRSTRAELRGTVDALLGGDRALTDHLEVETYTWSVLPDGIRPDGPEGVLDGIAAELAWARAELLDAGLVAA